MDGPELLFTIQLTRSTRWSSCLTLSRPPVTSHLNVRQPSHIHHCTSSLEWPTTLTQQSAPFLYLHAPPSLPITVIRLHPSPIYLSPLAPSTQNWNLISSNTPTLTHLIIYPLHLNDTHLNSYSVPSWYSGNLTWTSLDRHLWFVAAPVNELVPWCAWL